MTAPPLPDIFGNYTIKGIVEVLPPAGIDWLPTAPGWRALGLLITLAVAWYCWRRWQRWLRNRYRDSALQALATQVASRELSVARISELLKATALQCYPRTEIAALSGEAWVSWLNQQAPGKFSDASAGLLARHPYMPPSAPPAELDGLVEEVRHWILQHRNPADA